MKIAVFADIHNSLPAMQQVVSIVQREKPNKVVFCGDLFGGYGNSATIAQLAQSLDATTYFVLGNNDGFCQNLLQGGMEDYAVMYHFGRTLFFTHGDRYNKYRPPVILRPNDVLVYGHTHCALLQRYNDLIIANVGSVAQPRDGIATYAIMDESGITYKNLDGKAFSFLPFQQ